MARNRVFYQSEALYVGPSPATGFHLTFGPKLATVHGDAANKLGFQAHMNTAAAGLTTVSIDAGGDHSDNLIGGGMLTADSVGAVVGSGVGNLIKRVQRVQDVSYSFNITRQDVNQFGELAAIDRVVLESPTVSLDFSYILSDLNNEHILGFYVEHSGGHADEIEAMSAMSGFLTKATDERNYFIQTVAEGDDALGGSHAEGWNSVDEKGSSAGKSSVIGIGNGFLTSYTHEASVGDFPTASCSVEGLNMSFDIGTSGNFVPAVNPVDGAKNQSVEYVLPSGISNHTGNASQLSALRPGDITVKILKKGAGDLGTEMTSLTGLMVSDAKIQSYSLSFDLARDPLQKLGSRYAFSREITFPVTVTCTIDANVGDLYSGNLSDVVNDDSNINYDILLDLKGPQAASDALPVARYELRNCKIDSQEYTSDIGSNKSVSLTFSSQIGGTKQTDRGLFMSGVYDKGNLANSPGNTA